MHWHLRVVCLQLIVHPDGWFQYLHSVFLRLMGIIDPGIIFHPIGTQLEPMTTSPDCEVQVIVDGLMSPL